MEIKIEMIVPFKKARARHLRLGQKGEDIACKLLSQKGCQILVRNFRSWAGEIDIVARDGGTLCFIEVKTRMKNTRQRPAEGVSLKQKQRIYRSAMNYIKEIGNPRIIYRFDVIEVVYSGLIVNELRHWQNHFSRDSIFKRKW